MVARRNDWKTTPFPAKHEATTLDRTYTGAELGRILQGTVPEVMEDKWFTFYEEPWLYLHRSWTGFGIFQVRFEPVGDGARVAEVLVNRDPAQYTSTDSTADALLLAVLLDGYAGRDSEPAWQQYRKSQR
jgi:hypothetical protein